MGRSEAWFHKWWDRYLQTGPEGLYDLTRARHDMQRISPELERAILTVRRRLQAHATPATRYSLIGATVIIQLSPCFAGCTRRSPGHARES